MNTTEELKEILTFELWDMWRSDAPVLHDETFYEKEYPEMYHIWKKLLENIPRSEAFHWVNQTYVQISQGKIKYEWAPEGFVLYRRVDDLLA